MKNLRLSRNPRPWPNNAKMQEISDGPQTQWNPKVVWAIEVITETFEELIF